MYLEKRQSPEPQPEIDLGMVQEGTEYVYSIDEDAVTSACSRRRALVARKGLAVVSYMNEDLRAYSDQDNAERAQLASEID